MCHGGGFDCSWDGMLFRHSRSWQCGKQHQAAQEESRQELLEASRVEESAQAQAAVAALFETESTEETESTYTKEEALNDMVEDTLAGMTLEQKVAGLFFVTPEQLTGVSQVVAAGDATRESLENIR